MRIVREFIHGKKFDEQWRALGLHKIRKSIGGYSI